MSGLCNGGLPHFVSVANNNVFSDIKSNICTCYLIHSTAYYKGLLRLLLVKRTEISLVNS